MKLLRVLFFVLVFPAMVYGGMRCNDGCDLLQVGDSKLKVIECLGEPDYVEKSIKRQGHGKRQVEIESGIEIWFYRIDGWVYTVKLMDGVVVMLEDLGRD